MSVLPSRQPFISGEAICRCLQECIRRKSLTAARIAHSAAIIASLDKAPELQDLLIHAYSHAGSLAEAYSVFVKAPQPSPNTWQAIISAHVKLGKCRRAVSLYQAMARHGATPSILVCVFVIKACASMELFELGMLVHVHAIQSGIDLDAVLCTTLVDMYARCGSMQEAHAIFSKCARPDSVLWGALISGYVQHGEDLTALNLFANMWAEGYYPDRYAYSCILKALGNVQAVRKGMEIHYQIIVCKYEWDKVIGSTLVDTYAKCGALQEARKVFNSIPYQDNILWCSMVAGYAQHGLGIDALDLFHKYLNKGMKPDIVLYTSVLKACTSILDPTYGRLLHEHIMKAGLDQNEAIGNALLNLYSNFKSPKDAQAVFNQMCVQSLVAWNTLIAAYADQGDVELTTKLFDKMQHEGIGFDEISVMNTVKACTTACALEEGKYIHDHVTKIGLESGTRVGNTLIDMYAKCSRLEDACTVFDGIPKQDVVSWNALMSGCVWCGQSCFALSLFAGMHDTGLQPDTVTLSSIVKACGDLGEFVECFLMHAVILEYDCRLDIHVGNSLIDMYCKSGLMEEGCSLFELLPKKNAVAWNLMIGGYVQHGLAPLALKAFEKMDQQGVIPDNVTFVSTLRACGMLGLAVEGREIHHQAILRGQASDALIANTLVDMYMKCGSMSEAQRMFDLLDCKDIVSWNAMLAGLSQLDDGQTVLDLYQKMEAAGIQPDEVSFSSVVKACISLKMLTEGQLFHIKTVKLGLEAKPAINGTLLDLYATDGMLDEAQKVLQSLGSLDLVPSNEMVTGFVKNGSAYAALTGSRDIKGEGFQPDLITHSSILRTCSSGETLKQERPIHGQMIKIGAKSDEVAGSTLLDMYTKCGSLTEARRLFDNLPNRDTVIWNAMIGAYIQHSHFLHAFELFSSFLQEGLRPDKVIFSCVLKACCHMGAVGHGLVLHDQIIRSGFEADPTARTCLINMYGKSGRLQEASCVFLGSQSHTSESWCAVVVSHARQGEYKWAQKFMDTMQQHCCRPNASTHGNASTGCSYGVKEEKGQQHIMPVDLDHGLIPSVYHFHCLVDLLGRAGRLNEAEEILQTLPPSDVIGGWVSLLTACKTFGDNRLAKHCFTQLAKLSCADMTDSVFVSTNGTCLFPEGNMKNTDDHLQASITVEGVSKNSCQNPPRSHPVTQVMKRASLSSQCTSNTFYCTHI